MTLSGSLRAVHTLHRSRMNRRNMNPFLYSMRLRGLKHGSEEEYDMFEDFAICRARNRRMNGAADSKLQLEHRTPVASGEDGDAPAAIRAAIAQDTRRDANEQLATEDSSSCADDGKRCLEKDINANPLKTAAKNCEVKEISNPVGHRPRVDDHICRQAEESTQPDPPTSSNSPDHDPSEDCSKEDEVWRTCCLQ